MCKAIPDGGQRCACDTSKSRRLRRHNSTAISKYVRKPVVTTTVESTTPDVNSASLSTEATTSETLDVTTSSVTTPSISVESVKHFQEDVTALKTFDYTQVGQELVLSDGSVVRTTPTELLMTDASGELLVYGPRSRETQLSVCEQQTRVVGQMLNDLALERTGIDFDAISSRDKELIAEADADFIKKTATFEAVNAKIAENYEGYNVTEGSRITSYSSHGAMLQLVGKQDPEAEKQFAEYLQVKKELDVAKAAGVAIREEGSAEAQEAIKTQAAALKEVLKEVREIGGEVRTHDSTKPNASKALQSSVGTTFPTEWIEESNADEPFMAKMTRGRAEFSALRYERSTRKIVQAKAIVIQPEGWTPDPQDPRHLGTWTQVDAASIVDGQVSDAEADHLKYAVPAVPAGQTVWMHSQVTRQTVSEGGRKPRGAVTQTVKKLQWDAQQGAMVDSGETDEVWITPHRVGSYLGEPLDVPQLSISSKPGEAYGVAIHEFSHRMESLSGKGRYITGLEDAFLRRRTTDTHGDRESLQSISGSQTEIGRADHFAHAYVGREYSKARGDQASHEVLAMGIESTFAGELGGLVGAGKRNADHDLRNFTVGLLATG